MKGERSNAQLPRDLRFEHLPMGVYIADREGHLLECNPAARRLLGLQESDPIEGRIQDFHAEAAGFEALAKTAVRAGKQGDGFEKASAHLSVGGRDVFAEQYLKAILSEEDGSLVCYIGCLVDITSDHLASQQSEALRRKVEELTFDIGRILHANTSTLLMVNQTLDAAAHALEPELSAAPSGGFALDADELVAERAKGLAREVERLLEAGDRERRQTALPPETWEMLAGQVSMLRQYDERIPFPEMRVSTLRTIAAQVGAAVRDLKRGHLPKEIVRGALWAAADLESITCFSHVLTTRQAVVQMDATLRALRDFITAEVRTHEVRKRLPVETLIREAVGQIRELANISNVEMHRAGEPSELEIFGSERDLVRALANLLHNAVKYSWRRDKANAPWVSIQTREEDGTVAIEVKNWGVPVSSDEIQRGLVFELGYRGKWSTDRGRLGTGIGLTDALRSARAHGGELSMESRPARLNPLEPDHKDYYRQPFLTKVTLRLPLA